MGERMIRVHIQIYFKNYKLGLNLERRLEKCELIAQFGKKETVWSAGCQLLIIFYY